MNGYFYVTRNLINGKFYYGSGTVGNEKKYLGSSFLLEKSIKKYGKENFKHIPLKYFKTREEAFQFEDRFLKFYKISKNPMSYNIKDAGKGGITRLGIPHTEESKEKIRKSNISTWKESKLKDKQSIKSVELNAKGIIGMKGKRHKLESIEKIRKSNTGKSPSDDVRKIISEKTKEGMSNMSKEKKEEMINNAVKGYKKSVENRHFSLFPKLEEILKLNLSKVKSAKLMNLGRTAYEGLLKTYKKYKENE